MNRAVALAEEMFVHVPTGLLMTYQKFKLSYGNVHKLCNTVGIRNLTIRKPDTLKNRTF